MRIVALRFWEKGSPVMRVGLRTNDQTSVPSWHSQSWPTFLGFAVMKQAPEDALRDAARLREVAVSHLATEAICVARLLACDGGKGLFELCIDIRESAIRANAREAFEIISYFEPTIRDAQANYALLVAFELPNETLELDEFAFEAFRMVGTLIESNLQRYIKELCCLLLLAAGNTPDPETIATKELGQCCEDMEGQLKDRSFLRPAPWGVRVNQWRNIAQHQSYTISHDSIVATYGRALPPRQISLTRAELLNVVQALVYRLGALKASRAITAINHIDCLERYLPQFEASRYSHATALAASFATQGFKLVDLQSENDRVEAVLEDVAPGQGHERAIHCSQFVATISSCFPGASVQVRYIAGGRHSWTFLASAEDLQRVMALDDPLLDIASVVAFRREADTRK